ncbi:MAG: GNAT family N-acetyltransferase, partial [Candidatus Eisenbacteria sp.]|nr:GNAT family N-acetyltransferase [Candidatus Eisenbacteria bacterium]
FKNHELSGLEESLARLPEHSKIPIRFEVRSLFDIEGDDPDSAVLVEHTVETPWIKDYDAIKGAGPTRWPKRWDITNWGLLAAYVDGQRVAGCVLAHNTDGVDKLERRDDVVVLWDLRVHPDYRGRGIGRGLFEAAVQWASDRQCRELKLETQNINVPACRFYERQGCRLSSINRSAYEACPEEVELIWSLAL